MSMSTAGILVIVSGDNPVAVEIHRPTTRSGLRLYEILSNREATYMW